MARRNINAAGRRLVESFESFVPYVYDDQKPGRNGVYPEWTGWKPIGVLTVGYGHTNDAKHPLKIAQGLRVTKQQAAEILDVDLDDCEDRVSRAVKVPLSGNQYSALVSFDFNTGAINTASFVRALNRGDYGAVEPGLMQYVKATDRRTGQKVTLRGLVRRRKAEADLWNTPDKSAAPKTAVFRPRADEPKGNVAPVTPSQDVPLSGSSVAKGSALAGATGAGVAVDNAVVLIDQAQNGLDRVNAGTVLGLVAGLVILAGCAWALYARWETAGKPLPSWWPKKAPARPKRKVSA